MEHSDGCTKADGMELNEVLLIYAVYSLCPHSCSCVHVDSV